MTTTKHKTTPIASHTPAPWNSDAGREIDLTPNVGMAYRIKTIEIQSYVGRGTWKALAFIPADEPEGDANARRICAAVNACEGIGTEALKRGIIAKLLAGLQESREEIAYWHSDMLNAEERAHPRGSGWARVYDRLSAVLADATGRAI